MEGVDEVDEEAATHGAEDDGMTVTGTLVTRAVRGVALVGAVAGRLLHLDTVVRRRTVAVGEVVETCMGAGEIHMCHHAEAQLCAAADGRMTGGGDGLVRPHGQGHDLLARARRVRGRGRGRGRGV